MCEQSGCNPLNNKEAALEVRLIVLDTNQVRVGLLAKHPRANISVCPSKECFSLI